MTNETPMVSIRGVHKFSGNLRVPRGIDLDIAPEEVCAIPGPSGSGRSTLLRHLNQLGEIDTGRMSIGGELLGYHEGAKGRLYELPDKIITSQRSCIGMMLRRSNLFPHKTVLKNVMETPVRVAKVGKVTAEACILELLEQTDLADRADHYPSELPGGQQQRVAIARALAMDPGIMSFDESTSTLDLELAKKVLRVMKDLAASGMTMAIVAHEIGFAREVADTVVFMDEGQIAEMGSPTQVIDSPQEERTCEFLSKVL